MDSYFDWILQNPGLNHLTIKIFGLLDLKSFDNCLIVSKYWYQFIKENRNLWKVLSQKFPMHDACYSGYVNIVKLFIELNEDINARDARGSTPLVLACWGNQLKVVKLLCKQSKINVNAKVNYIAGKTTLHYACEHGQFNIVKLLLDQPSIKFQILDNFGRAPIDLAKSKGHQNIVDYFNLFDVKLKFNGLSVK